GVTDTEVVKAPDAAPDRDPGDDGERSQAEALGERAHRRQSLRDDVPAVGSTTADITGSDRRGHRQAGAVQPIRDRPLREGPCLLFATPDVSVGREQRNETTAMIVAQHQAAIPAANEMGRA